MEVKYQSSPRRWTGEKKVPECSMLQATANPRPLLLYKLFIFFNKSGLRFAVTQSIMTLGLRTCNSFFQKTAGLL